VIKRAFLLPILLLALLPMLACGIPRDAYETAVKERDAAEAELKQAKSELDTVRVELGRVRGDGQPKGGTVEIAPPSSTLAPKIALAEQILAFDSTRAQALRTRNELKDEETAKKLESTALSIFKTFDSLVKQIGDSELSKAWAETWPQAARQQAEKDNRPGYLVTGWVKFLDRLAALLKAERNMLKPPLKA
jgi:hypothetical protein